MFRRKGQFQRGNRTGVNCKKITPAVKEPVICIAIQQYPSKYIQTIFEPFLNQRY